MSTAVRSNWRAVAAFVSHRRPWLKVGLGAIRLTAKRKLLAVDFRFVTRSVIIPTRKVIQAVLCRYYD
ncbi:putative p8 protein [Pueraria lobata-associated crinivirus]|nr:putative p8 protein [Pueraria lobata-associated crinivirus]